MTVEEKKERRKEIENMARFAQELKQWELCRATR